jgi:hypothetical protein
VTPLTLTMKDIRSSMHICDEAEAVWLEIVLLMWSYPRLGFSPSTMAVIDPGKSSRTPASALLQLQLSLHSVQQARQGQDVSLLSTELKGAQTNDVDTIGKTLETLPVVWDAKSAAQMSFDMCRFYADVCETSMSSGVRVPALLNLAELIDHLLKNGLYEYLPPHQDVTRLWTSLLSGDSSPTVSQAVLRISGPLMATIAVRTAESTEGKSNGQMLDAWASMIRDAGHASNVRDEAR